jgi:hypothetical protein
MEGRKPEMSDAEKKIAEHSALIKRMLAQGVSVKITHNIRDQPGVKSIHTSTTGEGPSLQAKTTVVMENGAPAPTVTHTIADNEVKVSLTLPSTSTTSSYSPKMYGASSTKPRGPEYTIRLLLDHVQAESKDVPKLKDFSHLTLGCTQNDEAEKVQTSFDQLAEIFKAPLTFKSESVVNLGNDAEPLWGVSLSLKPNSELNDKRLQELLSNQFDSIMCPERDRNTYVWKTTSANSSQRCAHITIGSEQGDLETARKLLQLNCEFIFAQMDYKKVGRFIPHITKKLEQPSNVMTMSSR